MRKGKEPAPLAKSEIELRRWCIEQATRWPTTFESGSPMAGGYPGTYPPPTAGKHVDVDLIGRAKKILDWVKGS